MAQTMIMAGGTWIALRNLRSIQATPAHYFYDDARIIEEQNGGAVTLATYVYGNYVDEVLTMDRGEQTYYYHQNALWSVEAVTDGAATVVERYAYDAYGFPTVTDGAGKAVSGYDVNRPRSAIGNPYLFTGRQLDEESGLYFYRARYYDSLKGRFLQRDPKGYEGGMNLYEYVKSNPFNITDPKGTVSMPRPGSVNTCPNPITPSTARLCNKGSSGNEVVTQQTSQSSSPPGYNIRGQTEGQVGIPIFRCSYISYGHWCGSGGKGTPIDDLDYCCMIHDHCYERCGVSGVLGVVSPGNWCARICDRDLIRCTKKAHCKCPFTRKLACFFTELHCCTVFRENLISLFEGRLGE